MTENFCRSILYKMLEEIQTLERPRTLAEFLLESPPVRRPKQVLCGLARTQNLTFIQLRSPHPLQSEEEEEESETDGLDDQSLLFGPTNEQI